VLVVLCKFPSEGGFPAQGPSSVSTPRYFYNHLFSDDPNDGITSLREYYRVNSNGRLVISGYVTSDWLEMPHSYGYYVNNYAGLNFGAYPRSAQKLAEDAMTAAYHDFDDNLKFFDNDGPDGVPSSGDDDGYVDAVMVLVPGAGGEVSCSNPVGCQRLWAHESGIALYSDCPDVNAGADCLPGLPLGNLRGFVYNLGSEYNDFPGDNAVGTWIHEFSHTLGLPDLYDLSGGNGLGFYSLMAVGNYLPYSGDPNTSGPGVQGSNPSNLDAWSRQFLGFDNPVPATAGHTLYAAAKALVIKFSEALSNEVRTHNIHVTAVCPGFTISEFHDVTGTREQMKGLPPWMWLDSPTVARQGFEAVMAGTPIYINGRVNRSIALLVRYVPERVVKAIGRRFGRSYRKT
jgi:M6 family metalloprotease-like protein